MSSALCTVALILALASSALAAPFVAPRDPQCVAFSPNGELVALGFFRPVERRASPRPHPDVRKCGCVQIHDTASGKRLRRIETYGDLVDLRFSSDGKHLAMTRVFAAPDGRSRSGDEHKARTLARCEWRFLFDYCYRRAIEGAT